jgi:hypothetical protein
MDLQEKVPIQPVLLNYVVNSTRSKSTGPNSFPALTVRKQAALKSGKSGIQQQLDSVKAKIEREQNDLKAKRGKINYRSVDEIDREIK